MVQGFLFIFKNHERTVKEPRTVPQGGKVSTNVKPVSYLQGKDLPIYIWYDNYPTHADKDYQGRVSKVDLSDADLSQPDRLGLASLNITNVTEKDRGWYNCKVLFLNRDPDPTLVRLST